MTVICNATPLINFAAINRLDILENMFGKVIIPNGVYIKTTNLNFPSAKIIIKSANSGWLETCSVTSTINIPTDLDKGEVEVIALAIEINNPKVLLDEKRARQVAQNLELQVVGTINILLLAKNKKVITKVSPLLDDIIYNARYWINKSLYEKVLEQAGELK